MKQTMVFLVIGMAVVGLLIGCASTEKKDPSVAHVNYKQLCSQCHTLDRVDSAHKQKNKAGMRLTIERMTNKKGSGIDPNNIDDIVSQIY